MNDCLAPLAMVVRLAAPNQLEPICSALQNASALPNAVSLLAYPLIFLLNCLMETPSYWLAGRAQGRSPRQTVLQILVVNLTTHPLVYYVFPYTAWLAGATLLTLVALSEAFAFTVEAALLRGVWRYPWRLAILASTAANLTSWQLGAVLYDAWLADLL